MTKEEFQSYLGKVVSGTGHMSKRMATGSIALDLYEQATGQKLVPGSLNIELEQEIDMPPHSKEITRVDHEGEAVIFIAPARVNNIDCFAVRNKLAEDGKGRHSKRVIEVISAHKLREKLELEDSDKVTLSF